MGMKSLLTSSLVLIWGAQLEGHCSRLVVSTMVAHDNHLGSFCFVLKFSMPRLLTRPVTSESMGVVTDAAAAAESLQSCPTLCDPTDGSPPGSPSLGFSRQEHWSGLPFPSPMHESESEVAQSCLILSNPMDCSPLGSSVHGIFQARVLEWGAIAFSRGL